MRILVALLLAISASATGAQPIVRSAGAELEFKRSNPAQPRAALAALPGLAGRPPVPLCAGGPDNRSNMFWLSVEDHRWKTFVDVRESRKLRAKALRPAAE